MPTKNINYLRYPTIQLFDHLTNLFSVELTSISNELTEVTLLLNIKGVKAYLEVWTKSAMATEDLLVDDGGHRQTVETVGEGLPQLDVVASLA